MFCGVVKKCFCLSEGTLFVKTCFEVFFIFGFWANIFCLLSKFSGPDCQNCISRVQRKILTKNTSLEIKEKIYVCFGNWAKNVGLSLKTFLRGCQNFFLPVERNIFRKDILRIFFQFWILSENFLPFVESSCAGLSELHFTCPEEKFDKKDTLEYERKIKSVLATEQKISASRWKLFCGVVKTAFLLSKGTFRGTIISIVFCHFGISNECFLAFCRSTKNTFLETSLKVEPFLAIEQIFSAFCPKVFDGVVRTDFQLSRGSFCLKVFFFFWAF